MSAAEPVSTDEPVMVLVAGYLVVDPEQREAYLAVCVDAVEQARRAPGCLEFSVTADLVDRSRIQVLERWRTRADAEAFRGSGPSEGQLDVIRSASVAEYDVAAVRSLT